MAARPVRLKQSAKSAVPAKPSSVRTAPTSTSVPSSPSKILGQVRQIFSALPGVEERPCYGTPGFYYRKKFMARLREDGESLALKTTFADREHLLMTDPKVFFLTDHYRDYPAVLVHLSTVKPRVLRELLEDAWRRAAPKRVVAEWGAA